MFSCVNFQVSGRSSLRLRLLRTAVLGSTALAAAPIWAQSWTGTTSSDWHQGSNWSTGTEPGAADDAVLDTLTPNPALIGSGVVDVHSITVGDAHNATLDIVTGATAHASDLILAGTINASAVVTVSGAGSSFTLDQSLVVGAQGQGDLRVANGGIVTVDGGMGTITLTQTNTPQTLGSIEIGGTAGLAPEAPGTVNAAAIAMGPGASAIVFNHTSTNYVFSAAITGGGLNNTTGLVLAGSTTLTGDSSSFQGPIFIQAENGLDASLFVNGKLGGTIIVGEPSPTPNANILGGTGTVGAVIVQTAILQGTAGATLTMGSLTTDPTSQINVVLGAPTGAPQFNVTGDLTLDGSLSISSVAGFGPGLYRLFAYGGQLTDNGLDITGVGVGQLADYGLQMSAPGEVNLIYGGAATSLAFWDGDAAGSANNGRIDGGDGTWTAVSSNFTDLAAQAGGSYDPAGVIFQGRPGTVMVDDGAGPVAVAAIQFAVGGYTVGGQALTLASPRTVIRVGDGTSQGAAYVATIAAPLIGSGGLDKQDLGTLILTGANSYGGGTHVGAGTLQGDSASLQGAIANDAHLIFDQAGDGSFAGTITGTGDVLKRGSGTLTFAGGHTYSGATTIAGGGLIVLGGLGNSDVVVTGGLLGGTGPLRSLAVHGGTLSPGVPSGTAIASLTVAGNATLDVGSTFAVDLGASAASDRLVAGGRVTLGGGTLSVNGSGALGSVYQIVSAGGGVTGTFGAVAQTNDVPFLLPIVTYQPNTVLLTLGLNGPALIAAARTPNQAAAAHGVIDLPLTSPVAGAVATLSQAGAPAALDQLSGEIHASLRGAIVEDGRAIGDNLIDHIGQGHRQLWGEARIGDRRIDGDGNAAAVRGAVRSLTIGADTGGNRTQIGATAGYSWDRVDGRTYAGAARMEAWRLGAYVATDLGDGLLLRGAALYSGWSGMIRRSVVFAALDQKLASRDHATMAQGLAALSRKIVVGTARAEPFVSLDWVHLGQSDIRESGGEAALGGTAERHDSVFARIGVHVSGNAPSKSTAIVPRATLAFARALGDRMPGVDLAFAGSSTATGYRVSGAALARNRADLDLALQARRGRLTIEGGVGGTYAAGSTQTAVRLRLAWQL